MKLRRTSRVTQRGRRARHRTTAYSQSTQRPYLLFSKLKKLSALAAIALLAILYVVVHLHQPPLPAQPTVNGKLIVRTGYYLGVAEPNETSSYKPINKFAATIGRQPNIVLYYSALGDPFQERLANEAYAHGAVPFVQINPGHVSMAAIAAGRNDAYLRSYADQVRAYRHAVIIGFAPEMNGSWDSWGWHHTSPATWKAGWRHVVTVFRRQGASNVTWLWTVNAAENSSTGPINEWWPGANYVTWVGIDGYYFYSASTFVSTFGATVNQVRALTRKPILLSETAIGQVAGQAAKIPDLFSGVQAAQALGFVWFDQTQNEGIFHQNWRLEGNSAAVDAFRHQLQAYSS